MRVTGAGPGAPRIGNPPAEAIVPRLVAALRALDVFALDLPGPPAPGPNLYHGITIKDPRYADQWRARSGRADEPVQ